MAEEQQQQAQQQTGQQPSSPTSPSPTPPTNGATGWLNVLPAPYRNDESFKNYKDFDGFLKSYKSLESMIGQSIRIPKPDAPNEEWNNLYKRLGCPESPDKYEITRPELPEGAGGWDENFEGAFKGIAHQLGLTQKQVQGIVDFYAGQTEGLMANQAKQAEAWEGELRKEWGYAYDRNVNVASRTLAALVGGNGEHPLVKLLDATGLGNNPTFIRFFAELGAKMGEDGFVEGDTQTQTVDRDALQKRLTEIMSDKAYLYGHLPGHKELVEEREEIYRLLHPKQQE